MFCFHPVPCGMIILLHLWILYVVCVGGSRETCVLFAVSDEKEWRIDEFGVKQPDNVCKQIVVWFGDVRTFFRRGKYLH